MAEHKKQRVIVGMSGGVDSSVAALVLMEQGLEVLGLFMKNWEEEDSEEYCSAAEDLEDARAVCERLGIVLHTVNFSSEYWDRVFSYFLDEYRAGRTPNPDVLCNKEIKFRAFLDHALTLGADHIATGHYARIRRTDGRCQLLTAADDNKDQTYFLYALAQAQLDRTMFPIGDLHKDEVRRIAARHGFATHAKKDSTGICFIGERNFREFLARYIPEHPGDISTPEGKCIGRHNGLMFYTLGQRQGLGIGGRSDAGDSPWYVADKDLANNRLIVVQGHDHPLLFNRGLEASALEWISGEVPTLPRQCHAKVRYRQTAQPCTLARGESDRVYVHFDQPQRAITPGQAVVFYENEICLGGGTIQGVLSA